MYFLTLLKRLAPLLILLALLVGALVFMEGIPSLGEVLWHVYVLRVHVEQHFALALVLYMLTYIGITALSLPLSAITTVVGAILFGLFVIPFVVIAVTIGCILPYIASRYAFGDWCLKILNRYPRLLSDLQKRSFFYLLALRLLVLVPLWFLNFAAGALNVSFLTYITTTALGILPGTIAFVFIGHGVGEALNDTLCIMGTCQVSLEDFGARNAFFGLLILSALFVIAYVFQRRFTPSSHPSPPVV